VVGEKQRVSPCAKGLVTHAETLAKEPQGRFQVGDRQDQVVEAGDHGIPSG
jgi:hypothetical protein